MDFMHVFICDGIAAAISQVSSFHADSYCASTHGSKHKHARKKLALASPELAVGAKGKG